MATQDPESGTPTPPEVEQLATQEARLDRIALIGVFGSVENLRALIRLPQGKTQTVTKGDTLNGGTVLAIGEDQLVLSRPNGHKIMQMPRG